MGWAGRQRTIKLPGNSVVVNPWPHQTACDMFAYSDIWCRMLTVSKTLHIACSSYCKSTLLPDKTIFVRTDRTQASKMILISSHQVYGVYHGGWLSQEYIAKSKVELENFNNIKDDIVCVCQDYSELVEQSAWKMFRKLQTKKKMTKQKRNILGLIRITNIVNGVLH